MFTGIIEDLGKVESVGNLLMVRSKILCDQKIGASIAVNGACLTISDLKNDLASFDIMEETLKKTSLGKLKVGDKVNLERALKVGDRLGGHFVTGHIDCVGKASIAKVTDTTAMSKADTLSVTVTIPKEFMKFLVQKGSVALDGASLTIAEIGLDNFTVYLIPYTVKNTTFRFKKIGDGINVEFDLLGKYVLNKETEQGKKGSAITEKLLREKGFC